MAAAFVAALLFVMMGMAALGVDVSHGYANRQMMQSAADAAAMSGAIGRAHGLSSTPDGRGASADSGWTNGGDISVSIADAGNTVVAVVQQPMSTSFSRIFGTNTMTVAARAVATIPTISYCMIALDTSATKALDIAGNSTVGSPSCGIASNSTATGSRSGSNGGANIQGNSTINAPLMSAGSISEPGNPNVYSDPPFPMEGAPPVTDPYIANGQKAWLTGLSSCAPSPCNSTTRCANTASAGSTYDAAVGATTIHFKNNFHFNSGVTTFKNGIFYFYGKVSVDGDGTLKTQNATLVIFDSISVSSVVQLSAPTSGSSSGFAIATPANTNPNVIDLTGGTTSSLVGAIYAPNGSVKIRGSFTSACAQIIAKKIDAGGNISLDYNGTCGGQNAASMGVISLTE